MLRNTRLPWTALLGLGLLAALGLPPGPARAASDDIAGFGDLVLGAPFTPDRAAGDVAMDPVNIGGVTFTQSGRSVQLEFGGVHFDADMVVRCYQGRIQGIVVTPYVPLSMDVEDIARFTTGYAQAAREKYKDCTPLLDTFNDRAGVLALKDKDGDGLSLIWDVAKVSIIYQTQGMGEANRRENGTDSAGSTEAPARVR
jgi:hypothetical protein